MESKMKNPDEGAGRGHGWQAAALAALLLAGCANPHAESPPPPATPTVDQIKALDQQAATEIQQGEAVEIVHADFSCGNLPQRAPTYALALPLRAVTDEEATVYGNVAPPTDGEPPGVTFRKDDTCEPLPHPGDPAVEGSVESVVLTLDLNDPRYYYATDAHTGQPVQDIDGQRMHVAVEKISHA